MIRRPALEIYGYQRRWFLDRSRFKLGRFARQTGKTFTTTLEIVDDCFAAAVEDRRKRWVILSRGERQAKEAMDEGIKRHAQAYGLGFEGEDYDWHGDNGSYKALEVTLPKGSRITALPANPDTARGFSASVFLDEFAFHKDSREIWRALFPVISAGHSLRVTSTPNGKGNMFYDLAVGKDDGWSRHEVDIYQAVRDGLPRDIEELRAGIRDKDSWRQEYELEWLDEASAWLPYDLISSVEDDAAGDPDGYQGGVCYVGMDVGIRHDLTVIWVWELVGDVMWCREIIELRRERLSVQAEVLDAVMRRYRVARLCIDQTGLGEGVVEAAKTRYGDHRVEGVIFSAGSKLIMATNLKQAFEDRACRIPMGNPDLRHDLHKLRREASPTGAPRFVAERDEDHADRTWAAALGINARGERAEYGYTPVSAPARGLGGGVGDSDEAGAWRMGRMRGRGAIG